MTLVIGAIISLSLCCGAAAYTYKCADRLCTCTYINSGWALSADCSESEFLTQVPMDRFTKGETLMMATIFMGESVYCTRKSLKGSRIGSIIIVCNSGRIDFSTILSTTPKMANISTGGSGRETAGIVLASLALIGVIIVTTLCGVYFYKVIRLYSLYFY